MSEEFKAKTVEEFGLWLKKENFSQEIIKIFAGELVLLAILGID